MPPDVSTGLSWTRAQPTITNLEAINSDDPSTSDAPIRGDARDCLRDGALGDGAVGAGATRIRRDAEGRRIASSPLGQYALRLHASANARRSIAFLQRCEPDLQSATQRCGAADAAHAGGYPQLSGESVIKANPQVIFLDDGPYGESASTVSSRPGWSAISAVKNKHVIVLPLDIPDRWGPRLVDFYRFIAQATAKIN